MSGVWGKTYNVVGDGSAGTLVCLPPGDACDHTILIDTPFFNWLLMFGGEHSSLKSAINSYLGLVPGRLFITANDYETLQLIWTAFWSLELGQCRGEA